MRQMPPSEWTTTEQKKWLQARIPEYESHAPTKDFSSFWPPFCEAWFEEFPERSYGAFSNIPVDQPLTDEQKLEDGKAQGKRRKQLKAWMRWHSPHGARARATANANNKLVDKLINPKTHRSLTKSEMYSQHFYTRIKVAVEDRCLKNDLTKRGDKLSAAQAVAKEMFAKENDEIKAKVAALMEEQRDQKNARKAAKSTVSTEERAKMVVNMPALVRNVITNLASATDYAITVIWGGPSASNQLTMSAFHCGELKNGAHFGRAYADFDEKVMAPFSEHLRHMFPSSVEGVSMTETPSEPSEGEDVGVDIEGLYRLSPPIADSNVNDSDSQFDASDRYSTDTIHAAPAAAVDAPPATIIDAQPATVVDASPITVVDAQPVTVVDARPSTVDDAQPVARTHAPLAVHEHLLPMPPLGNEATPYAPLDVDLEPGPIGVVGPDHFGNFARFDDNFMHPEGPQISSLDTVVANPIVAADMDICTINPYATLSNPFATAANPLASALEFYTWIMSVSPTSADP
ncbi:hypothetical protein BV22DRAFT_1134055, partial [Leucogyrophana mollusca]